MDEDAPTVSEHDDHDRLEGDVDAATMDDAAETDTEPDGDRLAVSAAQTGTETTDVESSGDVRRDAAAGDLSMRELNQGLLGQLVLHYPSRDVTVFLDGDAALRVMRAHQLRDPRGLGDRLRPMTSTAAAGWLTLDVEEPLAMSWLPGLPARQERMSVDPLAPDEASAA